MFIQLFSEDTDDCIAWWLFDDDDYVNADY